MDLLRGISIFLVGMMGTGKTTIGQVLARRIGYRFFDTDVLIERVTQHSITEIFATQGEERFREIESQVLEEMCAYTKSVIATGGIVIRPQNWSYLRHGLVIWLDVPIDLLVERLATDTMRPLLSQPSDLKQRLETLLEQRRSLYAESDLHISIENAQTPDQVVTQILDRLPTVIQP